MRGQRMQPENSLCSGQKEEEMKRTKNRQTVQRGEEVMRKSQRSF